MSRTIANAVIDVTAAMFFVGMVATGYVLRFPLPPGTNRLYTLWGLTRHQWGTIHFWISIGLLGILLTHVAIHWQWVVNVVGRRLRLVKSAHASQAKTGLATLLVVAAVFALFALSTHWGVREISSLGPEPYTPTDQRPSQVVGADSDEGEDALWEDVRVLVDQYCLSCHGPGRQSGGFRVDRRDDVLGMSGQTPWVVPGDDARSPLIAVISGARPDMRMANRHKLQDEDVELIRAWIKAGARWPAESR